jgi:hypothetical protein
MSTRGSITYGEGCAVEFSLETEAFDEANVYLELTGSDFSATPSRVEVVIPVPVWEHLRKFSHPSLKSEYAGKTDWELEQIVRQRVSEPEYAAYIKRIFGTEGEQLYVEKLAEAKEERDTLKRLSDEVTAIEQRIIQRREELRRQNERSSGELPNR